MTRWVRSDALSALARCPLIPGDSTGRRNTPRWSAPTVGCRSNFSIKSQDIRHRSRSFERLRRYPPILAALPALSARCLQLRHEPCPCMSLHMHAIPTWRIRVKGCCVDRLNSPPDCDQNSDARSCDSIAPPRSLDRDTARLDRTAPARNLVGNEFTEILRTAVLGWRDLFAELRETLPH